MAQGTFNDSAWSTDSTTRGTVRGDSVSDNFYQQFSNSDIKQYYDSQRADATGSGRGYNQSVADMLSGFSIEENHTGSATIWEDGQKGRQYFFSDKSDGSGFDPKFRPLNEGNGKADEYFGKGGSGFSYDQIQMRSSSDDVVSKDPKPGDGAAEARRNAYERLKLEARTAGDSDVNREKAQAIGKKLLDGKDISKDLQELPDAQRLAVMRELKRQLADTPGTTMSPPLEFRNPSDHSQDTRIIQIKTKDGTVVAINENRDGTPNRIQVNNPSWFGSSIRGARDVYVNPALAQKEGRSDPSNNPVLRLRDMTRVSQEELDRIEGSRGLE